MAGADTIAACLADLRQRRHQRTAPTDGWPLETLAMGDDRTPVVDLTPVLRTFNAGDWFEPYTVTVMPVWSSAIVGYDEATGGDPDSNVRAVLGLAHCVPADDVGEDVRWTSLSGDHQLDWANVAHVHRLLPYVFSDISPRGRGPVCVIQVAANAAGEVLDVTWNDMEPGAHDRWQNIWTVWMMTLDLLACRNVELREPRRDRATRRRIQRALPDARVTEMTITRSASWSRGDGKGGVPIDARPLHTVRGHAVEYGVNGKGLLFGRWAGRFWVPQHARGRAENGTTTQHVTVES